MIIEELDAARKADTASGAAGSPARRQFLMRRFDVDKLLTYRAILNWANAFDDLWHNHFFYKEPNGKFVILPYDFDRHMTGSRLKSYYVGELNNPDNFSCCGTSPTRRQHQNALYDALFKAFKKEFNAKLRALDKTVLSPENVAKHMAEIVATSTYDQAEARRAPGGTACTTDYKATADAMQEFARKRHADIVAGVGFQE
jgi:spore coat protein CotH